MHHDLFTNTDEGVSVHTGFPNAATDARLQELDLNKLLIQNSISTFLMRIAGSEWQRWGIYNDDIVVIDRALHPRPTDKVIWLKENDFAISDLASTPIECTIWGVVTTIIHQYRKEAR